MTLTSLIKDAVWTVVENPASAGTTDLVTDILDMAGFEAVLFHVALVDSTNTGTVRLNIYGNTANSTSGSTLIGTGSTVTYTADDSHNNKILIHELLKPTYRYVYCTVDLGTANTATGVVTAIQYGGTMKSPTTQPASVAAANLTVCP